MSHYLSTGREFLKDLGLRLAATAGAVLLIVTMVTIGNRFNIRLLQSQGGILISVIITGEILFFLGIILIIARNKI